LQSLLSQVVRSFRTSLGEASDAVHGNVYIVDDDSGVRVSLSLSLRAAGIDARPFASARDFLEELVHLRPGPVLVDVLMPEMGGIELLEEIMRRGLPWPVIVITGAPDVRLAVRAMKLGASEFLEKPIDGQALLAAVERAEAVLEAELERWAARDRAQARVAALSPREQDVLRGLAAGLGNRDIAQRLNLSPRTVEMHRSSMMRRIGAMTLPEALRTASDAGVQPLG
jgi:two-component system response regulator FixJ